MNEEERQLSGLAQQVGSLTRDGKVDWQETDAEDTFLLRLHQGSVLVGSLNADGEPPYELRLQDPEGREVARVVSSKSYAGGSEEELMNRILEDVYYLARGSGLGTARVVTNVLDELKEIRGPEPRF